MSVADETSEALFVCFEGVMTKLHNMKAYEAGHLLVCNLSTVIHIVFLATYSCSRIEPLFIQAGDGVNPEETQTPSFVADMVGKT